MDDAILTDVYAGLDKCVAHATAAGRTIKLSGLIPMALWINMSGPPDELLDWLSGKDPHVPAPGNIVDQDAVMPYMKVTKYFTNNPGNLPHFENSIVAGLDVPLNVG